jgi:hypothetical protein
MVSISDTGQEWDWMARQPPFATGRRGSRAAVRVNPSTTGHFESLTAENVRL